MKLQFAVIETLIASSLLVFVAVFITNITYGYSSEFNSNQFASLNFVYDFTNILYHNSSFLDCFVNHCPDANNIIENFAIDYKLKYIKLNINNHFYGFTSNSFIYSNCKALEFCFPVEYNKSYLISCIYSCGG
ncbi:hypothetical protein M1278_01410 [Candidatus Marsarchaeota archaeon]|nr:hypothetical protein [Candidatus Marsarchaeota archaeon]